MPAQYFRSAEDLDSYLEYSNFLADVNNERAVKNATYRENLRKLERFVMFMFSDDKTVVPKESAWFAEVNSTTGEMTNLQDRPLYREDWLGLRALDEEKKLEFWRAEGEHMQLNEELLIEVFKRYFRNRSKATFVSAPPE